MNLLSRGDEIMYDKLKYDRLFNKEILVDAIVGAGLPSIAIATHFVEVGLAEFNGDQWNESWCWKRHALADLKQDTLMTIYREIKRVMEEDL